MPPRFDPPPETRLALVVATSLYADPGLRQLRAPARDAADLAQVLADPDIGGFAVTTVLDQPAQEVRLAVEDFLATRGTGDLLLVYLSCHGLLDARRRLFFAAADTRKDRLGSTAVEAAWVLDQLEHCRARRQVLILDSCFSGAFVHGTKGEADLSLRDRFVGQGRGRVVLTASTATEYSFEGEPANATAPAGSVFTAALVRGLRTGAADIDRDGHVSVDDAYAYVFDQVQAVGAAQTPQRWLYGAEGRILLARSPAGPLIVPAPLPESLQSGLDSPHPGIRVGAVTELGQWLASGDPARIATARRHLQQIVDTDIPSVARPACDVLGTGGLTQASPPSSTGPSTLAQCLTDHKRWGPLTSYQAAVAFSPDGRLLACVGIEKTVRLWDPAAGTPLRTLTGHTKTVYAVAFSPDGRLLASAGRDGTVRLWDPAAGTPLRTLTGHTDPVHAVAFSPDGRLLASASWDGTVRLWDPAAGTPLRTLTGHAKSVEAVAFSPDGRLLASAGLDNNYTVRLWDPAAGTFLRILYGHTSYVHSLAFSPDGGVLASFSTDRTVRLWT